MKSSTNQPDNCAPVDLLGGHPVRELAAPADVRGPADLGLVPGDEHAVLRGHQVGLDVVGAERDRQAVRRQRVLRPVAGRATVCDDERVDLPHASSRARSSAPGSGAYMNPR